MTGREDRTQVPEAPEPTVLRMHPSLGDLYRQKISHLVDALADPAVRAQAAEAMRSLISKLRMVPAADAPDGNGIASTCGPRALGHVGCCFRYGLR
ncbi:hypothetical protein GCM10011415_11360 [Salipiger pallidus]|uniref:Uncharacterized protein n=1 Tax=Salipiger pallidus TaxID=1775170 RepID=A0A8J2ZHT5_9RHOB|nr:hypothetical protein GCM10011415_11360 [Salipiger pallidus]